QNPTMAPSLQEDIARLLVIAAEGEEEQARLTPAQQEEEPSPSLPHPSAALSHQEPPSHEPCLGASRSPRSHEEIPAISLALRSVSQRHVVMGAAAPWRRGRDVVVAAAVAVSADASMRQCTPRSTPREPRVRSREGMRMSHQLSQAAEELARRADWRRARSGGRKVARRRAGRARYEAAAIVQLRCDGVGRDVGRLVHFFRWAQMTLSRWPSLACEAASVLATHDVRALSLLTALIIQDEDELTQQGLHTTDCAGTDHRSWRRLVNFTNGLGATASFLRSRSRQLLSSDANGSYFGDLSAASWQLAAI
ncbi:MAG: hypothetical protein SGPRY_011644, partial [Prymnesium sp.]